MRNGRGKKYSDAFKEEAVRLVRKCEKPITELADELGVGRTTLYGWLWQRGVDWTPVDGKGGEPHDELTRLQEENRVLKMEREILKKATAFFAKENK